MATTPTSPVTPPAAATRSSSVQALSIHAATDDTTDSGGPTQHKAFGSTACIRCNRLGIAAAAAAVVCVALLVGVLAGVLTRSSSSSSSSSPSTYRAAAVQYLPYSNTSSASLVLSYNLAAYGSIVASLAAQQPDIVVFPEGGLGYLIAEDASATNASATRQALLPFCEQLPPVSAPLSVPCLSLSASTNPQLTSLSCLARAYSTSLVVNLCQLELCVPGAAPSASSLQFPFARTACPSDGFYLWSSNVAISSEGAVQAVYAKAHLFDTLSFDIPTAVPVSWQEAGLTFGTFVSFDIEFAQPAQALLLSGVQQFVLTSWWATNQPPQLTATMIQDAWSDRWQVNLIAANALSPAGQGGGVYSAGRQKTVVFNPAFNAQQGQFLVAVQDLPRTLPPSPVPLTSPTPSVLSSSASLPPVTASASAPVPCVISEISEPGSCAFLSPTPAQTVAAQSGDVSCIATVTASDTAASSAISQYALFASQDSYYHVDTPSALYLESCFLLRCSSSNTSSSPLQCDSELYSAPMTGFSSISILAAFNCSRFAATEADGGVGEEGDGPAGDVLPMLALGSGVSSVSAGSGGFSFEYVGRIPGSSAGCWWNLTVSGGLQDGLFSFGFYAVDGQADYSLQ